VQQHDAAARRWTGDVIDDEVVVVGSRQDLALERCETVGAP